VLFIDIPAVKLVWLGVFLLKRRVLLGTSRIGNGGKAFQCF